MTRHPRRSLTASLVALVLLAVCVLVVVACVQLLLDRPQIVSISGLHAFLTGQTAAGPLFLTVSVLVALVGLVLLVVALRPGTPTVLPLSSPDPDVDAGITRRSLDRALSHAATGVDGVDRAGVRSRGRRAAVTAHASFGSPGELKERVRTAVGERLEAIGPARTPRVTVSVNSRSAAAAGADPGTKEA